MIETYRRGQPAAQLVDVRCEERTEPFRFRVWRAKSIEWSRTSALLFLQGVPLAELCAPLVLLRCVPRPPWSPSPGLDEVTFAELPAGKTATPQETVQLLDLV